MVPHERDVDNDDNEFDSMESDVASNSSSTSCTESYEENTEGLEVRARLFVHTGGCFFMFYVHIDIGYACDMVPTYCNHARNGATAVSEWQATDSLSKMFAGKVFTLL